MLVENLLTLARVEGSTFECSLEELDLQGLISECWQPFADKAKERGITDAFNVPKLTVHTDREMLRVVLHNLFSNAVCHANDGGGIEVSCAASQSSTSICVTNTGNQLAKDEVELAFDRLWRGDSSRTETGEHFGLGLTIVKKFVEALGGSVEVNVDASFRIHVTLPV